MKKAEIRLLSLRGGAPVVMWIVMVRCEAFGWDGKMDSLLQKTGAADVYAAQMIKYVKCGAMYGWSHVLGTT